MKKIILAVLVLAVLLSGGIYVFSRKAPGLLKGAIESAINKTVKIEAIDYRFPWKFELRRFQILETEEPFVGETCFAVDRVLLDVSPLSLSQKKLILSSIEVSEADVVIRNRRGKLLHAFSGTLKDSGVPAAGAAGAPPPAAAQMPLVIHRFHLTDSRFRFIDYDVREEGFVIQLDRIEAEFKHLTFPHSAAKTGYTAEARLPQGRGQRAAALKLTGWTRFLDDETDALFSATDLFLPYFKPYYAQVTPASIEEGWLASRAALRVHDRVLTANVDLEMNGLYFQSYEEGEQLFGLKAEEILSFLRDSAGRLKFQIVLQWDLADRGLSKREQIRHAIEQSLKKTLLGSVGNILEKTFKKLSDDGIDPTKDDWEDALKKVKKLFR